MFKNEKTIDYSCPHKLTCICLEFRMALGILDPHIWVSLMKDKWQKRKKKKKANDLGKHVITYEWSLLVSSKDAKARIPLKNTCK